VLRRTQLAGRKKIQKLADQLLYKPFGGIFWTIRCLSDRKKSHIVNKKSF